jgi:ATP/maltotriose-dependent transcriptional regulator MalT
MDFAGAVEAAGNLERATEIFAFLSVCPFFEQGREYVHFRLTLLEKKVSAEVLERSKQRGEAWSLAALIQALKTEFVPPERVDLAAAAPTTSRDRVAVLAPPLITPLTEHELMVLELAIAGLSNREIAEKLVVTVGTVKKHLNNIFKKLDVRSRTQAAVRSRELNLFP